MTRDIAFDWTAPNGLNVMLDTGWIPGGSPLQVRLYVGATGHSEVGLGGEAGASWPSPITIGFTPEGGHLAVDYGFELWLKFRLHINLPSPFDDINWEGDIPIGSLPSDLRMVASASFDSFVLPGAVPRPISVSDATSDIRVVNYNALGSIIPIPGLSGGIALDARANLDARYSSSRIQVGGALPPLLMNEGATTQRRPPPGGDYGAGLEVDIRPTGSLEQVFSIVLTPTVYVDLFGLFSFSIPVFSIPINLLDNTTTVTFPSQAVRFPLADVEDVDDVDFGAIALGTTAESSIGLINRGEADLVVTIASLPEGVTAAATELVLTPGLSDAITLTFTAAALGDFEGEIVLTTNDPDSAEIRVLASAIVRNQGELPDPDGGVDGGFDDGGFDDGGTTPREGAGCGCRTAGGAEPTSHSAVALVLALGLVIARRRR